MGLIIKLNCLKDLLFECIGKSCKASLSFRHKHILLLYNWESSHFFAIYIYMHLFDALTTRVLLK